MANILTDEQRREYFKILSPEDKLELAGLLKEKQDAKVSNLVNTAEQRSDQLDQAIDITKNAAVPTDEKAAQIEKLTAENEKYKNFIESLGQIDHSKTDIPEEEKPGHIGHTFKGFNHFCHDMMTEGENGETTSEELKSWRSNVKATLTAGAAEEGGTLIPTEYAGELLDRVKRVNPILTRAMIIPMGTNKIDVPYLESFDESGGKVFGNVQWFWKGEEAQFTGSNFETGVVELVLRKCTGLARVSRDLIKYSPQSIEAILRRAFDYGMNRTINRAALRGTGVGQPLGVLVNDTARIEVPKATGQAAATFIYDNVLDMIARLYVIDDDLGPAAWFANRTVLPQIGKLSVAVGTGGSGIFLANNQVQAAPNYTMLGIPLQWSNLMSAVGTAGDVGLFDWSQYLVGQPAGTPGAEFEQSIHLYFDYASTAFRFIFDMDGQPWWSDKFRPEYGDSQAPFITLAVRA